MFLAVQNRKFETATFILGYGMTWGVRDDYQEDDGLMADTSFYTGIPDPSLARTGHRPVATIAIPEERGRNTARSGGRRTARDMNNATGTGDHHTMQDNNSLIRRAFSPSKPSYENEPSSSPRRGRSNSSSPSRDWTSSKADGRY